MPRLSAVAFGHGRFVAVSTEGRAMVSPDGVEWTRASTSTTQDLWAIIFTNGLFAASGKASIITSSDGINWTTRVVASSSGFPTMKFLNQEFVAAGWGTNAIYTSSDGTNWFPLDVFSTGGLDEFKDITFGNGAYIAARMQYVDISIDLLTWSHVATAPECKLYRTAEFGLPGFVVAGGFIAPRGGGVCGLGQLISFSSNGLNWVQQTSTSFPVVKLVQANQQFTALTASGRVLVSTNGRDWPRQIPSLNLSANNFTFAEDRLLIVGDGFIAVSENSTNAVLLGHSPAINLNSIAAGSDRLVTVGTGAGSQTVSVVSQNGSTWMSSTSNIPSATQIGRFKDWFLRFNESYGDVQRSHDGIFWEKVEATIPAHNVFSDSNACLVAAGFIWRTTDATNFSRVDTDIYAKRYIVKGDNGFVAGGGTISVSSNGIDWTLLMNGAYPRDGAWGNSGAFAKGTYVSVGRSEDHAGTSESFPSPVAISTDVIHWTNQYCGVTQELNAVIWTDGEFIAVGKQGTIITSPDGTNWTHVPISVTNDLFSVTRANSAIYISGSQGLILRSDVQGLPGRINIASEEGGLRMDITGSMGAGYMLERKTQFAFMTNWTPISTFLLSNSSVQILVTNETQTGFYRVRLLP